ncbi:MAG: hypothetical protein ACYDA4_14405 [Ignavibacteriaceae bacterium]
MFKVFQNIPDGIYDGCFTVFIGEHDKMGKWLGKRYPGVSISDDDNFGESFALESKDKIMVNVIWLQKYNRSLSDQGVLVHELLHYTIGELKRRGFSLNSGSEEAYTYFLESVYKNALERLNKKTKKQ